MNKKIILHDFLISEMQLSIYQFRTFQILFFQLLTNFIASLQNFFNFMLSIVEAHFCPFASQVVSITQWSLGKQPALHQADGTVDG